MALRLSSLLIAIFFAKADMLYGIKILMLNGRCSFKVAITFVKRRLSNHFLDELQTTKI